MKVKKRDFLVITVMLLLTAACSGEHNDLIAPENIENDSTRVSDTIQITENDTTQTTENEIKTNSMNIKIGDTTLTATLVDNSSVDALKEILSKGSLTVEMRDYGNMEKVGSLGQNLPRNDEQITTQAGDIILYQGSALVIYYDTNSWNFTRLGKIDNITQNELKNILGQGNVTVTLSLP